MFLSDGQISFEIFFNENKLTHFNPEIVIKPWAFLTFSRYVKMEH